MTDTHTRAGVVGVGRMGTHHARVYKGLPEIDLVGVADADASRAESTAKEYGATVMDSEDLFKAVDIASIAVPTRYHHEVASEAIDHGVSVLIEKPFVTDPNDGYDLIKRAEAQDLVLQVGHVERFNPVVDVLEDILPDLDVIAFSTRRLGPPVDRDTKDDVVMDLMIHDIDIVLSLLDGDLESMTAMAARDGRHATAQLDFQDDIVGTMTASRVTQEKIRELAVTARECRVNVDYMDQSIQVHRHSSPEFLNGEEGYWFRNESIIERPMVESGEPLKRELTSFVRAVENNQEPVVTGEDGLTALALARKISAVATAQSETSQTEFDIDEIQTV